MMNIIMKAMRITKKQYDNHSSDYNLSSNGDSKEDNSASYRYPANYNNNLEDYSNENYENNEFYTDADMDNAYYAEDDENENANNAEDDD